LHRMIGCVALALVCWMSDATAQETGQNFTVQKLYEICQSSTLTDQEGCGLYLTGVGDIMEQVALELTKPWATKAARSDLSIHAICTLGTRGHNCASYSSIGLKRTPSYGNSQCTSEQSWRSERRGRANERREISPSNRVNS